MQRACALHLLCSNSQSGSGNCGSPLGWDYCDRRGAKLVHSALLLGPFASRQNGGRDIVLGIQAYDDSDPSSPEGGSHDNCVIGLGLPLCSPYGQVSSSWAFAVGEEQCSGVWLGMELADLAIKVLQVASSR